MFTKIIIFIQKDIGKTKIVKRSIKNINEYEIDHTLDTRYVRSSDSSLYSLNDKTI